MPIPDELRGLYDTIKAVYCECDFGRHRLPRTLFDLVLDEIERLPRAELEHVAMIVHLQGMPFALRDRGSTTGSKSNIPDQEASRYELHHFVTSYLMIWLEADPAIIAEQSRRGPRRDTSERPSRDSNLWEERGRAHTEHAMKKIL